MQTQIFTIDENNVDASAIDLCARILCKGGLVAFPTETVYGLGAIATDAGAAKKIYAAKGRPSDNPLIIHIKSPEDAELYVERGKCYFRQNEWGSAINDFRKAQKLSPEMEEAKQYLEMAEEILEFRYKDIYNP